MNTRKWLSSPAVLLAVLIVLAPVEGVTYAQEPEPPEEMDGLVMNFDGDAYADLVIGVPYADIEGVADAGAVSVVYGTSAGLTGTADEYWRQDILDASNSETYEYFGRALAVGDFDGDGYYDLAVGVPHEDVVSVAQAGAVNVIYGAADGGLTSIGNEYWNQDVADMEGVAEEDDHFGSSLAAGDFDGDGYDDLAIGVPEEDIGTVVDAGCVQVMYGTSSGLNASYDEIWDQEGEAETGDGMGRALAAGDFDNDGYDDLAVGIPYEDLGSIGGAGAVEIYYGSSGGLTTRVSNDFWHQNRTGVADTADENDYFGWALTVGDFDADGYADLAVGVPYEDVGSGPITNAGAVNVLYGSSGGIASADSDYWHQDSSGIQSLSEAYDLFGWALAAGDFDGDGYADMAVGVPYEDWDDSDTGIVQVLYGTAGGLTAAGDQLWRQDSTNIQGGEEADDRFGYTVAAGDFDNDNCADLAVGVPYESIGTVDDAGAAHVIYGSTTGLVAAGNQFWYRGHNGLSGTPVAGDQFGRALAAIPVIMHEVYLPLVLKN